MSVGEPMLNIGVEDLDEFVSLNGVRGCGKGRRRRKLLELLGHVVGEGQEVARGRVWDGL